jgi:hypothetical protein
MCFILHFSKQVNGFRDTCVNSWSKVIFDFSENFVDDGWNYKLAHVPFLPPFEFHHSLSTL